MTAPNTVTALRCGEILLVEDSIKDARLIFEVLQEQGQAHRLHLARNGEAALNLLRSEPPHADRQWPDLVLLDVNLPSLSGTEVLSCIKTDPALQAVPVLMLSTSRAERDVAECYARHANGYLVKPASYDALAELIESTLSYWLGHNQLPPKPATA